MSQSIDIPTVSIKFISLTHSCLNQSKSHVKPMVPIFLMVPSGKGLPKTMENHHANGKTHYKKPCSWYFPYFSWHFPRFSSHPRPVFLTPLRVERRGSLAMASPSTCASFRGEASMSPSRTILPEVSEKTEA